VPRIRIFVSSPGDVPEERLRADLIVDKLSQEYSRFFAIESYRWEHEAMLASHHFQDVIEPPSSFDIVILILWSRLGTPLPEQTGLRAYRGIDNRAPVTGTEWEYEEALKAARANGAPDLLAFRNVSKAPVDPRNPEAQIEQLNALNAFWRRHFADRGVFLAAYDEFETLDEFAGRLEQSLRKLLERRIRDRSLDKGVAPIWLEAPFRGLQSYDVKHAPIFFGRDGLATKAIERLAGNAIRRGAAFLMMSGASGSGKSSVVKAAMVPRLMKPQRVSGMAFLRRAVMRPAETGADLVLGLVQALTHRDPGDDRVGLPELIGPGQDAAQLAAHLRAAVAAPGYLFASALGRLTDTARNDGQILSFEEARLILVVDQMEEIFTVRGIDATERGIFVKLLAGLARSGVVWVIVTLRSDFWHRVEEVPDLVALATDQGRLDVAAPSPAEIGEMINKPALAAGLCFETDPQTNIALDRVLAEHATAAPGVLPLLSFTLDELYRRARDNNSNELTYADYDDLGRLEGSITSRADTIMNTLPAAAQAALPRVLRAVATVPRGASNTLVSRPVPLMVFAEGTPARELVEALIAARLLTATAEQGIATVRLVHEALISRWTRARKHLENDHRNLETRTLLESQFERWSKATGRARRQLLLRDPDLANAVELERRWGAELDGSIRQFIGRSRLRAQLRLIAAATAAVVFAAVITTAMIAAQRASNAQRLSDISLALARSQSDLREGRIHSALDSAAWAFGQEPNAGTRSALLAGLMEVSPYLAGHLDLGAAYAQALAWSGDTLAYSTSAGVIALLDPSRMTTSNVSNSVARPVNGIMPSIPALRLIGPDRVMMALDDGSIATLSRQGEDARVRPPATPVEGSAHSAAISRDGSRVIASGNQGIHLFECGVGSGPLDCTERQLTTSPAAAVEFNPAGDRTALADDKGNIQILSLTGVAAPVTLAAGFAVKSLAWHPARDWLAAGGENGHIVIFDLASGLMFPGPVGNWLVAALAWSPKGDQLAFVCEELVACVARVANDGRSEASGNILHLPGHPGRVTRLAFSPDGTRLASADDGREIIIWSMNPDRRVTFDLTSAGGGQASMIAYGQADRRLAAAYPEGIAVWEAADRLASEPNRTVAEATRLHGASGAARALAWSPAGALAAGYSDGAIALWSRDLPGVPGSGRVSAALLQLGFAGNILAALSDDDQIRLFDSAHLEAASLLEAQNQIPTRGFALDSGRDLLFASHEGGEISRWKLASRAKAGSLPIADPVAALALSVGADGRFLATTGGDQYVKIFDLTSDKLLVRLPLSLANEGQETAGNVGFSSDGHLLAALGADGRIYIWQVGETFTPFAIVSAEGMAGRQRGTNAPTPYNLGLAWLGPASLAILTGGGIVRVINLETPGWQTRFAGLYFRAGNAKLDAERNSSHP
jgi:WD40 repeat protein